MLASVSCQTIAFLLILTYATAELDGSVLGELSFPKLEFSFYKLKDTFNIQLLKGWEGATVTSSRKIPEGFMTPTLKELQDRHGDCSVDYLPVQEEIRELALGLIPSQLRQLQHPHIEWQVISADRMLIPHIDENRMTALNLYVQTSNETTVFYKNPVNSYKVPIVNNTVFDVDWVTYESEFIAEDGDIYLINVHNIHSVLNFGSRKRIALSFGFHEPFEVVHHYLLMSQ